MPWDVVTAITNAFDFQKSHEDFFDVDRVRISPDLVNLVSQEKSCTLNIKEDQHLYCVRGYILSKTREAHRDIVISAVSTRCWKRFTLCKELCHVLTDDETVRAHRPVEQLSLAIKAKEEPQTVISTESFCTIMAIELMIPPKHRPSLRERVKNDESTWDIANDLKIPEWVIEFYYRRTNLALLSDLVRNSFLKSGL